MTEHRIAASTLSLAGADAMIEAARREAESRGARVSIAVLDRGGHLVAFARMDGIHPGTVAVSEAKARTALLYNRPTEALASALAGGNSALLTLPDLLALPGGVPVPGSAAASGAIGVSGAAPEVDEAIARAGAAAITEG
jgi:glc operon protein GlcG